MNSSEMKASAASASGFLRSLANPHRLLILCQLVEGEKSVGQLEELLHLRQAHLSQLLARLRRDGLVKTRRDSRTIFYRLDSPEAVAVLEVLYGLFCDSGIGDARIGGTGLLAKTDAEAPSATLPLAQSR